MADIRSFEQGLYTYMDNNAEDVLTAIRTTGKLAPETEERLKAVLDAYVQAFLNEKA